MGKTPVTLKLDNAVLDTLRTRAARAAMSYEDLLNDSLVSYLLITRPPRTRRKLKQAKRWRKLKRDPWRYSRLLSANFLRKPPRRKRKRVKRRSRGR